MSGATSSWSVTSHTGDSGAASTHTCSEDFTCGGSVDKGTGIAHRPHSRCESGTEEAKAATSSEVNCPLSTTLHTPAERERIEIDCPDMMAVTTGLGTGAVVHARTYSIRERQWSIHVRLGDIFFGQLTSWSCSKTRCTTSSRPTLYETAIVDRSSAGDGGQLWWTDIKKAQWNVVVRLVDSKSIAVLDTD